VGGDSRVRCTVLCVRWQTGLGMFTKEALEGVVHDLEQMDMIAMPIALSVLAFVLRSWRLMLIPCVCIGESLCLPSSTAPASRREGCPS
jgi:hypothetical protein